MEYSECIKDQIVEQFFTVYHALTLWRYTEIYQPKRTTDIDFGFTLSKAFTNIISHNIYTVFQCLFHYSSNKQ